MKFYTTLPPLVTTPTIYDCTHSANSIAMWCLKLCLKLIDICMPKSFPWDYITTPSSAQALTQGLSKFSDISTTYVPSTETWAKILGLSWPFRDIWQLDIIMRHQESSVGRHFNLVHNSNLICPMVKYTAPAFAGGLPRMWELISS